MVRVAEVPAGELPGLDQTVGGVQQFQHLVKKNKKTYSFKNSWRCKAEFCLTAVHVRL